MNNLIKCFKNFKLKAFTLSFDDGTVQDLENMNMMRHFNLKGTFNLNSALMKDNSYYVLSEDFRNYRLNVNDIRILYDGFEVASHTLTHPDLTSISMDEVKKEISEDVKNLSKLTGYDVLGFAYPYGTYNDEIINYIKESGLVYARSVKCNYNFKIPASFYDYGGTCTISDPKLEALAKKFINKKVNKMQLFYVWGHSYELDMFHEHEKIYNFYKNIANKDDIYYASNIEIFNYLNAMKKLKIVKGKLINNSNIDLYVIYNNEKIILKGKN